MRLPARASGLALALAALAFPQDYREQWRKLYADADRLFDGGHYVESAAAAENALAFATRHLGPNDADTTTAMMTLGLALKTLGQTARAERLYQDALVIRQRVLGPEHPWVAITLNNLAELYKAQGRYVEAKTIHQRGLEIRVKEPPDFGLATSLHNLATVHDALGEYDEAERLFQQAISLFRTERCWHSYLGRTLGSLGTMYDEIGAPSKAKPLYRGAIVAIHRAYGPSHPWMAAALDSLAGLELRQGSIREAEELYSRGLEIRRKAFGPLHIETAISLANAARTRFAMGDFATAEAQYRAALQISTGSADGRGNPVSAGITGGLARLLASRGRYAEARPLTLQALQFLEASSGRLHPGAIRLSRDVLAGALAEALEGPKSDSARAVIDEQYPQLLPRHLQHLRARFSAASRAARRSAAEDFRHTHGLILAFATHYPPLRTEALQQAATSSLHVRGRLSEEGQAAVSALRRRMDPESKSLLDRVRGLAGQIASASGPDGSAPVNLADLTDQYERAEAELLAKSRPYRDVRRVTELKDIATVLAHSAGCAVEFDALPDAFSWLHGSQSERLHALVVTPRGVAGAVDLGPATAVREAARRYWLALAVPDNQHFAAADRAALAKLIVKPLEKHLGGCKRLFLSPDASLARVPFELLPSDGAALGERFEVTLLGSLRDVVRLGIREASETDPVGIFDPDYGTRPSGMPRFHRLDSTAAEQAAVAKHIPGLQSFAGKRARKEILLQGEFAPRILHVASHAFFRSGEDPLLGSGIALAGANGDDTSGILTGLEMAGMSLRGCQLVVLSACETGLSDSTYGDGLLGMQRSLTLAGSRSQLLSLWRVPAAATVRLMDEFYGRLMGGSGKAEALRGAKDAMRREGRPVWEWAGWVLYGDPGPIYE